MYVIIVYDVNQKRVNAIKSLLREYLFWIQNSVFEGEITESKLFELKERIKRIINFEEDNVIIFSFKTKKEVSKETMGVSKINYDIIL